MMSLCCWLSIEPHWGQTKAAAVFGPDPKNSRNSTHGDGARRGARCCVEIVQAGIVKIVSRWERTVPTKWSGDLKLARALLAEARINYREIAEKG